MEIRITLQPKQRESIKASEIYPIEFFGGAKGGGKSYAIRARQVLRRLKYANTRGLIVRKTYPELLANHIYPFFKEYPMTVQWYNRSEKKIHYPNGSTTEFSYLQNTDDVYTYQGREYEDIDVDEVTQHDYEVIKILRSSLRTTNPFIKPRMYLTGNPGGKGHAEIKRIFIDRDFKPDENPEDYHFTQAFVTDNRALMENDPEYIERLKDLPEHLRKAYLEGDWNIFTGQAFSEFSKLTHVIKPLIPDKDNDHYLSMDWGYSSKSLFAAYLHAVVPMKHEGANYHRDIAYKEWAGNQKTPDMWAEEIFYGCKKIGIHPSRVEPDSAMLNTNTDGSKSIARVMEEKWKELNGGVNWCRFNPATKNRVARVALTHNWLSLAPDGLGYALVTESCPYLIKSLPTLIYDEHKIDDVDTTGDDHGWDGWSYGLVKVKFTAVKAGSYTIKTSEYKGKLSLAGDGQLAIDPKAFFKTLH